MIRRLTAGEGALLRSIRLRALADAPYAFASTLTSEAALSEQDWDAWAGDPNGAVFIVDEEGRARGMAGGYLADGKAHLWGMWVDPSARRQGLGRRLVKQVLAWANSQGMTRIDLHVTDCPEARPAAALYESLGFTDTGGREPLASDPSLVTRTLACATRSP